VNVTAYTWGDLILFLAWGLICYLWGNGDFRMEKALRKGGENPTKTTNKPNNPPSGRGGKDN
jgi:hypothetical protein